MLIYFSKCLDKVNYRLIIVNRSIGGSKKIQEVREMALELDKVGYAGIGLLAKMQDIIEDFDGHFRRFHQFLGVGARAVKPVGVKKEVRPLSEVITNYSELRKTLLDTPWGYLVERGAA